MPGTIAINHTFTSRITRNDCPIVPVVTDVGNIKWIKIRPDVSVSNWLVVEWREADGRKVGIKSIRLTSERAEAGAMLLKDAYEAEGWPAGWKAYADFLDKVYTTTRNVEGGGEVKVQLGRPKLLKYPEHLLPKAVFELRAKAGEKAKTQTFEPPEDLRHPADVKAAANQPKGK